MVFAAKIGAEERNLVVIDGEAEGLIYYILYLEKKAITAFCEKRMQNIGTPSKAWRDLQHERRLLCKEVNIQIERQTMQRATDVWEFCRTSK